jgi:serine O-acetyltransferase
MDSVDILIETFKSILDSGLPPASAILKKGQDLLQEGDISGANRCYQLNQLIHNSHIPNSISCGKGVKFAYGGIGLVIHNDCEIGDYVMIGSNVTLGGRANAKCRVNKFGKRLYVPRLENYSYVATGSAILGGVVVGMLSIVGANSVVLSDVQPLAIVAGNPAKQIGMIDVDNCLQYKSTFSVFRNWSDLDYINLVRVVSEGLK